MANLFDTLLKSWNEQDVQTYRSLVDQFSLGLHLNRQFVLTKIVCTCNF